MSNPSLQKNDIKTLLDIIEVGKKFSDRTIFNAVTHFILMFKVFNPIEKYSVDKGKSLQVDFQVTWPTSEQISVQNCLQCICNLMRKWKELPGMEDWLFCVEFDCIKPNDSSISYMYEVVWSVPTPAYPEPQVTVSVYFYIEASKVKPSSFPVDVTYVFEGNKFIHRPSIPFQPKWLFDILDIKTMLFKSITF